MVLQDRCGTTRQVLCLLIYTRVAQVLHSELRVVNCLDTLLSICYQGWTKRDGSGSRPRNPLRGNLCGFVTSLKQQMEHTKHFATRMLFVTNTSDFFGSARTRRYSCTPHYTSECTLWRSLALQEVRSLTLQEGRWITLQELSSFPLQEVRSLTLRKKYNYADLNLTNLKLNGITGWNIKLK